MRTDVTCQFNCDDCEYKRLENLGEFLVPDVKVISIQSSNICNALCLCCTHHLTQNNKEIMSKDIWEKILLEIRKIAIPPIVHFGILDEPLCDPFLLDRIKDLKSVGVKEISFISNCSFLTEEKMNLLIESGVTFFFFSLLSPIKNEFSALTKMNFDEVVFNIKNAIKICEEKKINYQFAPAVINKNRIPLIHKLFPNVSKIKIRFQDNRVKYRRWLNSPDVLDNCPCLKTYFKYTIEVDGSLEYFYEGLKKDNILNVSLVDIFKKQRDKGSL